MVRKLRNCYLVNRTMVGKSSIRGWWSLTEIVIASVLLAASCGPSPTAPPRIPTPDASVASLTADMAGVVSRMDDVVVVVDGVDSAGASVDNLTRNIVGIEAALPSTLPAPRRQTTLQDGGSCAEHLTNLDGVVQDVVNGVARFPLVVTCNLKVNLSSGAVTLPSTLQLSEAGDAEAIPGTLSVALVVSIVGVSDDLRDSVSIGVREAVASAGITCANRSKEITCAGETTAFCAGSRAQGAPPSAGVPEAIRTVDPAGQPDAVCDPMYIGLKLDAARVKPKQRYTSMSASEAAAFVAGFKPTRAFAEGLLKEEAGWVTRIRVLKKSSTELISVSGDAELVQGLEIISQQFARLEAGRIQPPSVVRLVIGTVKVPVSRLEDGASNVTVERFSLDGDTGKTCAAQGADGRLLSVAGIAGEGGLLEVSSNGVLLKSESTTCRALDFDLTSAEGKIRMSMAETLIRELPSGNALSTGTIKPVTESLSREFIMEFSFPSKEGISCPGKVTGDIRLSVIFSDGHAEEGMQHVTKEEGQCEPTTEIVNPGEPEGRGGVMGVDSTTGNAVGKVGELGLTVKSGEDHAKTVEISRSGPKGELSGQLTLNSQPDENGLKGAGRLSLRRGENAQAEVLFILGTEGAREAYGMVQTPQASIVFQQRRSREGFTLEVREVDPDTVASLFSVDGTAEASMMGVTGGGVRGGVRGPGDVFDISSFPATSELNLVYIPPMDDSNKCEEVGQGEMIDYETDSDLTATLFEDGSLLLYDIKSGKRRIPKDQTSGFCADQSAGR